MSATRPLKGILLICLVALLLACLDSLSKALAAGYGVLLVLWVRYLTQSLLLAAWQWPRRGRPPLRVQCPALQLWRGLSLLGLSLFFLSALSLLPQGEATAVQFLAPLLVVVLAVPLLGERASLGQWLAVGLGFAGVLIIVRPGGGLLTPAMLLPVCSATCYALYQIFTRLIGTRDSAAVSNLCTGVIGLTGLSLLLPGFWAGWPEAGALLAMASLGAFAVVIHTLLTVAFQSCSPVLLAPFGYLQIPFAALLGLLVFDHRPEPGALLGMAVIIASGLLSAALQARRRPR